MKETIEQTDLPLVARQRASVRDAMQNLMLMLRPFSRITITSSLGRAARIMSGNQITDPLNFPWWAFNRKTMLGLRAILLEVQPPMAIRTVAHTMTAVRSLIRELQLVDGISHVATAEIAAVKAPRSPPHGDNTGRVFEPIEIQAIMLAASKSKPPVKQRNLAMIAVMNCGLRRDETCRLNIEDVNVTDESIRVAGKGGHNRVTYMVPGAKTFIEKWIEIRGHDNGPMFWGGKRLSRNELIPGNRVGVGSVNKMIMKISERAGIGKIQPHDFRRTFCTRLLRANVDVLTCQRLMGHSKPETTAQYDYRTPTEARAGIRNLPPLCLPPNGIIMPQLAAEKTWKDSRGLQRRDRRIAPLVIEEEDPAVTT